MAKPHHPQEFLKSIENKPNEGSLIVEHFCSNCHAKDPLIPVGAPFPEDKAWDLRLKQGKARLFKHTDEGIGLMPSRGGCFECTDRQLLLAIFALLSPEQRARLSGDDKFTK